VGWKVFEGDFDVFGLEGMQKLKEEPRAE